ncbi:MAG: tetratricopeptide repeat protein, partial [Deltaproteobacteria bacterium]|nr:tetratricopeptide repeat protein [Deltaproteobacteria bacterium]
MMTGNENQESMRKSVWAPVVGLLTSALLLGLIELMLFIVGVDPRSLSEDRQVGFTRSEPTFIAAEGGEGQQLTTAPHKRRWFNVQNFPREKPAGSFRVFCLGGSTTYGRPYNDTTSFCGWLRAYLETLYPERKIEVINAGGISYASYRVVRVMEELSEYQPDVFVVYSGHNEFLERRTYQEILEKPAVLRELDALLAHTRIYSAMLGTADRWRQSRASSTQKLTGEVSTLLGTIGPEAYRRDDAQAKKIVDHYAQNLLRMADLSQKAGASLLLVRPASSLKECKPFKSEDTPGITATQRREWKSAFREGLRAQRVGDVSTALMHFERAAALNPRHAETWYRLGESRFGLGQVDLATQAFVRARDEDIVPLRATTALDRAFSTFGADRSIAAIDFQELIRQEMQAGFHHPIPGEEFFLDHVHPTIEGHRLLALALLEQLMVRGDLPRKSMEGAILATVEKNILATVDQEESGIALRNLAKVLSWAGKDEDAARLARRALTLLPGDEESLFIIASETFAQGAWGEAIAQYREVIAADPLYTKAYNNLAIALVRNGDLEEALPYYHQALALDGHYSNAHYNLANAYSRLGREALAIHHFRRAIDEQPDDTDSMFNLARLLARQGRTEV